MPGFQTKAMVVTSISDDNFRLIPPNLSFFVCLCNTHSTVQVLRVIPLLLLSGPVVGTNSRVLSLICFGAKNHLGAFFSPVAPNQDFFSLHLPTPSLAFSNV